MRSEERITLRYNVGQLDRIILALLNNGYNKKFAGNVQHLLSLVDEKSFITDFEKEVRVYIIKKIVNMILTSNLESKESILSFLDIDGKYYADAVNILNDLFAVEFPESEMYSIDKTISDSLKYSAIEKKSEELSSLLMEFETETYESFDDHIERLEDCIGTIGKDLRDARESIENSKSDLNLSNTQFINLLGDIIEEERNPDAKVRLGEKALNQMFDGGLENSRVYCMFAVAKGWKSGFLLTSAIQAKKFNKFHTKPGLKPVIVYLTMENSIKETVKRIWNHAFGDSATLSDFEKVDAANELEKAGIFTPNDPNSAELLLWYRPNKSISTTELHGMLEDLEKEGKQCVLLVLDYLKRIRSSRPNKELRLELGQITDELNTIAKDLEIPILTAQQLNREAYKSVEEASTFEAKLAAIDKMGASNVGESIDIVQNVDYGIILNRVSNIQANEEGAIESIDNYLSFKLIACRGKQPPFTTFTHRFRDGNSMALVEDWNFREPTSVFSTASLSMTPPGTPTSSGSGKRRIVG